MDLMNDSGNSMMDNGQVPEIQPPGGVAWQTVKRLGLRIGLGLLAGLAIYFAHDYISCDGPQSVKWAEASFARMDESDTDWIAFQEAQYFEQVLPLELNAQARYQAQSEQSTPACMKSLQDKAVDYFYKDWQIYVAVLAEDYDSANNYAELTDAALGNLQAEFDALAEKYNWELSE